MKLDSEVMKWQRIFSVVVKSGKNMPDDVSKARVKKDENGLENALV